MTEAQPTYGLFIVRFAAELATKSGKSRSAFSRVLRQNILAAMARAEARLDAVLVERAVAEARRVDLAELTPEKLRTDYLFVSEAPEDAEVIDLRPPRRFARGHLPEAVNRAPEEVLARLGRMDKRRPYALDCSFGTVSAHFAEVMQQFGYQAYALRHGPAPREREALEAL